MKFSLILVTFNLELYIERSLISLKDLLNNDLFEIIVIDDGSTDNTVALVENFFIEYSAKNVKFIKKNNGGLSSARNLGLELITGDFVIFLDGDDTIISDNLINVCKRMRTEYDVLISIPKIKYEILNELADSDAKYFSLPGIGRLKASNLDLFKLPTVAWSKIFKRDKIIELNAKFPEGLFYEDNYWFWLIMKNSDNVFLSEIPFYVYTRRKDSIMTKTYLRSEGYAIQRIFILEKILEDCRNLTHFERKNLITGFLGGALKDSAESEKDLLHDHLLKFLSNCSDEDLSEYFLKLKYSSMLTTSEG